MMKDNDLPQRKPLRIKEYDYDSDGCYYLTICTAGRKPILSAVTMPSTDCEKPHPAVSSTVGRDDPGAPYPGGSNRPGNDKAHPATTPTVGRDDPGAPYPGGNNRPGNDKTHPATIPTVGRDDLGAPPPAPLLEEPLFGTATIRLTPLGQMVERYLLQISDHYPGVTLNHYAIMPNHIHLLLTVTGQRRAESSRPTQRETQRIPRIVAALKRLTNQTAGRCLWQDSYYDHVVRSERDYLRIWEYIDTNPAHWAEDEYYQERP